jgi:SAM-dependent methyltransferase
MPPVSADADATLFDEFVENYEEACSQGLAISGESRDYFSRQRVSITRSLCDGRREVQRIVDFGCGLGHTVPSLLDSFPGATAVGVDTAKAAIESAQRRYGCAQASFTTDHSGIDAADLVYTNGTFHHIEPDDRGAALGHIFRWLAPGGLFALWENNPWNPGTRLVMSRIPFDRDAKTLSPSFAKALVQGAGFTVLGVSSHFYFPSWLKPLRPLERWLSVAPFVAQYCVLAVKPGAGA